MTLYQRFADPPKSLVVSVLEFVGIVFAASAVGAWIEISAWGEQLFAMPIWAWDFALIASVVATAMLRFAYRLQPARNFGYVSKLCAFLVVAGLWLSFLTGAFEEALLPEPIAVSASLEDRIFEVGRSIAWGTLVGIPLVAMIANGLIALSALRAARADRGN